MYNFQRTDLLNYLNNNNIKYTVGNDYNSVTIDITVTAEDPDPMD